MMRHTFTLFIIAGFLLGGCKKNLPAAEQLPDEQNLTVCAADANCIFMYADNAGMDETKLLLTKGQYRVFWAYTGSGYSAYSLYIMAPMQGNHFELGKEDISAGRVKYQNTCANCFSAVKQPFDGKIIGRRLQAAGGLPERWIIEATLKFQAQGLNDQPQNTYLKQYFLPAN